MPYIKQERRNRLNSYIDLLLGITEEIPEEDRDGELNYIITTLIRKTYVPLAYKKINRAMGVLECVKQEYYRRVASKYEDLKAKENGDVYE